VSATGWAIAEKFSTFTGSGRHGILLPLYPDHG
jgi:hypothetical protein